MPSLSAAWSVTCVHGPVINITTLEWVCWSTNTAFGVLICMAFTGCVHWAWFSK